jgi:hypothetical protein
MLLRSRAHQTSGPGDASLLTADLTMKQMACEEKARTWGFLLTKRFQPGSWLQCLSRATQLRSAPAGVLAM